MGYGACAGSCVVGGREQGVDGVGMVYERVLVAHVRDMGWDRGCMVVVKRVCALFIWNRVCTRVCVGSRGRIRG